MHDYNYINNSWNKHAPMCNINNYYQCTYIATHTCYFKLLVSCT